MTYRPFLLSLLLFSVLIVITSYYLLMFINVAAKLAELIITYHNLSQLFITYHNLSEFIGTYRKLSQLIGIYRKLSLVIGSYHN